ncbi:MAG: hypothetical protein UU37_C0001G0049 [Candidatus Gottesmanbacteria bacterium GW2011_GWA2_41_12]|uniref:DUF4352 domain-containing protein n=1 Tax=Candidatus Gottesmanbacteria bacterium GW2011_GWA2_41_12 TaxID=1618440 RepID=A0A0G0WW30_9BACT|nr:MAG: hypothetical protein UU37_C0001G0049 [Candidatus Gottesmanbacteria bacterium GW2011_GWA2_41_12]
MVRRTSYTSKNKINDRFVQTINFLSEKTHGKKKLLILLPLIIVSFLLIKIMTAKNTPAVPNPRIAIVNLDKSFEFIGLTNQGKEKDKIKMNLASAEKMTEVAVKDQTFKAKNNKLFLIVNLELTNDSAVPLNIFPGDLVRLTVNGDDTKKYAPDLHNNMVMVAPISTRLDRVGFVVDKGAGKMKLMIGQLEDKKQEILLPFK